MALTWYRHLACTIRSPDNVNISKHYADCNYERLHVTLLATTYNLLLCLLMFLIYLIFSFQKAKRSACQVEGCKGLVTNIRRHMRICHPEIEQDTTSKRRRTYERKECPKCGLATIRLDLHLQRMHGMAKGEQLRAAVKSSISRKADTQEMVALGRCLMDYK